MLNAYRIKPVSIEEYVADIPDFSKESEKGLKKMLAYLRKKYSKKKLTIETLSKLGYPVETMQKSLKPK